MASSSSSSDKARQQVSSSSEDDYLSADERAQSIAGASRRPSKSEKRTSTGHRKWTRGLNRVTAGTRLSKITVKDKLPCPECASLALEVGHFVLDDDGNQTDNRSERDKERNMGTFAAIQDKRYQCGLCELLVESLEGRPGFEQPSNLNELECVLKWVLDGKERLDSDSRSSGSNPSKTLKRTRRLHIQWWSNDELRYDRAYIVLVARDGVFSTDRERNSTSYPSFFLGRHTTSLKQSNSAVAKSWLKLCLEQHKTCPNPDAEWHSSDPRDASYFNVVDTIDKRICGLPENKRYLALSYTWGKKKAKEGVAESSTTPSTDEEPRSPVEQGRFEALSSNIDDLEERQGIGHPWHRLPAAVQNAIELTNELGYRYIWIDRLCIIQDDEHSWRLNARAMDTVYGNADLTICAADGQDAETGLLAIFGDTGLHSGTHRPAQNTQKISKYHRPSKPPLELMLSWPAETYISLSRWNDRGWTFQERMLSPRCLICVSGRMYFQCRTTCLSEDIHSDEPTRLGTAGVSLELNGAPAQTLAMLDGQAVGVYKTCIEMYTGRDLTKPNDVLNAFLGIGNTICQHLAAPVGDDVRESTLIHGLPASHFDWALLWEAREVPTRREGFPSWSWIGWLSKKGMTYSPDTVADAESDLPSWLRNQTWITYYIRSHDGDLRLVWNPLRHKPKEGLADRWKGYDTVESKSRFGPKLSESKGGSDFHGRPWNSNLPAEGRCPPDQRGKGQFNKALHSFRRPPRIQDVAATDSPSTLTDFPYLQFWTWSARFKLRRTNGTIKDRKGQTVRLGEGLCRFEMEDKQGEFVGEITLDERWSRVSEPQEFIALSAACLPAHPRIWEELNYTSDTAASNEWRAYNVMMIGSEYAPDPAPLRQSRLQKQISYRKGIGRSFAEAFGNTFPPNSGDTVGWKEILLG